MLDVGLSGRIAVKLRWAVQMANFAAPTLIGPADGAWIWLYRFVSDIPQQNISPTRMSLDWALADRSRIRQGVSARLGERSGLFDHETIPSPLLPCSWMNQSGLHK